MVTYLPHRDQVFSKEVDVNLSWHLRRLLHVHVVVEKVLEGWHLAQRLELVAIALRLGRLLRFRLLS